MRDRRPLTVLFFAALAICTGSAVAAPPEAVSARSEMQHTGGGPNLFLGVDLPFAGPRAIDSRQLRSDSTVIIFVFDQNPASIGAIETTHGTVNPISGIRASFPDTVAVHLDGVPDGEYVTVTVRDIESAGGEVNPEVSATVGYLVGDTTQNGVVNVSDIRRVGTASGQSVATGDNRLLDTSLNGVINVTDIRLTASRSGRRLGNTAPTITGVPDQTVSTGTSTGALPFVIDDFTTPADQFTVMAMSSNTTLLPDANIVIGGSGANRTVTATPVPGMTGSTMVLLVVSDGALTTYTFFNFTVVEGTPPAAIVDVKNHLGEAPLTVDFDASRSVEAGGPITAYAWDFGDGATGAGQVASHTYTQPGTYTATLSVLGSGGQTDIDYVITVSDGSLNLSLPPSANDSSRFLWQAAFGPSEDDVSDVQNLGFEGWIDSQMALPATVITQQGMDQAATRNGAGQVFQQRFAWANIAVEADDQLRQRVAWALIQILVNNNDQDNSGPIASRTYYNFMIERAFGNYRDLLENVTFSRPMGEYLTYINNAKANPSLGTVPDENYAREIMQLFSMGLFSLNPDGTHEKDPQGNLIPTYDNDDIVQFARVFTGLRISNIGGDFLIREANPMRMDTSIHEFGSKQLLDYPGAANNGFIPARAATEANGIADVNFAIDNVFNHPTTPPFVCRQLIQRLVTSNPTPAYVGRVSAVFVDDGTGTRGNLGAVVKAILLDPEARDRTYSSNPYFGKIVEPFLLKWALYRVLDRRDRPTQPIGLRVDQLQFGETDKFGQAYMTSPSVFNFYLPDYSIPNSELDRRTLDAPEMQIVNEITIFSGMDDHRNVSVTEDNEEEPNVYDDLRAVASNPLTLIAAVDDLLMYGSMSTEMQLRLFQLLQNINGDTDRVRAVVYLTIASPEFQLID